MLALGACSPNVRAVMSLREPVSRTLSQYRYSYNRSKKDWQSMHQAALQAIPIMQQCFDTHLAAVDMQQIRCGVNQSASLFWAPS